MPLELTGTLSIHNAELVTTISNIRLKVKLEGDVLLTNWNEGEKKKKERT